MVVKREETNLMLTILREPNQLPYFLLTVDIVDRKEKSHETSV